MNNTRLPMRTWLLAMYLLGQSKTNLSVLEVMRHLGVSYPAAWRMKHKLMHRWPRGKPVASWAENATAARPDVARRTSALS